jgi:hypothetical protein
MVKPARKIVWGLLVALALGAAPMAQGSRSPVADAAQAGDREAVRALLKQGVDVNAAQGDGTTALHWAAMKGDAELVRCWLPPATSATTRLAVQPLYGGKGGHSAAWLLVAPAPA